MSLYYISLPKPENIDEIDNIDELDAKYSILYKIHSSGEYAELQEIYTDKADTSEGDYFVVPVSSVYIGKRTILEGKHFVNVIGSSKDKPEDIMNYESNEVDEQELYRSRCWLDFYNACMNCKCIRCLTNKVFYNWDNTINRDKACNNKGRCLLVGGHVIISPQYNKARRPDSTDIVGIIPICHKHNKFDTGYMKPIKTMKVPILKYKIKRDIFCTEVEMKGEIQ